MKKWLSLEGIAGVTGRIYCENLSKPKHDKYTANISICIVNYNGLKYLKDCFELILKNVYQPGEIEILMVDNSSSDGSVDYVRTNYPWVKVLALNKNYGFAQANNIGAENAEGKYVVFLNNDTVVTPNWIEKLVEVMEKDKDVGIVGSKLLMLDNPGKINSAGGCITLLGGGYDIGFLDEDSDRYDVSGYRGCVCAAAMMVRKEEFINFGGFDEDYFMYFEDVDLCWRYWLYNKKVVYVSESVVYHKFSGTSGESRHSPLKVFYGTRNSLFNMAKNYEIHNLFLSLILFFFYNLLKTIYFLIKLKLDLIFSIFNAYWSSIIYLSKMLKKRKNIQQSRKIKDKYLFDNSLIISFYESIKEFFRLLRT